MDQYVTGATIKELREKGGISEMLKAENQMLWVQRMNAVRETATEIVNTDLIYGVSCKARSVYAFLQAYLERISEQKLMN